MKQAVEWRNWKKIERVLSSLKFLNTKHAVDFIFSCIPFHNEIYERGGNSSMYAKPFTCVTQTGLEEKVLNSAFATCRCIILLHAAKQLPPSCLVSSTYILAYVSLETVFLASPCRYVCIATKLQWRCLV